MRKPLISNPTIDCRDLTEIAPKDVKKDKVRNRSPHKNSDPGCISEMLLEEQETRELFSPARIQSCKERRNNKLLNKQFTCDNGSLVVSNEDIFSGFSPKPKGHGLHPENPYGLEVDQNYDSTKRVKVGESIFRDHRSLTHDSGEGSYEDITSQLEPVPLVMTSCYSHFGSCSGHSVSTPLGVQEVAWLNAEESKFAYN